MPSDFVERARVAYAALPVPAPPLAGIRARRHRRDVRFRATIAAVGAAAVVASAGLSSGAGAAISGAIRVWISGGSAAVEVRGLTVIKHPMRADLADLAARATFPVVFPMALPQGMRLRQLMFAPSDHPTTITLVYANATGGTFQPTLVDGSSVTAGTPPAGTFHRPVHPWNVGREVVMMGASHAYTAAVERAMQNSTPAASLAANDALAAAFIDLNAAMLPTLPGVERVATSARDVLLDARHRSMIPSLARDGRALLDDRTVTLTDIPQVGGAPDYRHAKLQFSRTIAVPADGVREIAAYLRAYSVAPHASLVFRPDAHGAARIVVLP
jgi:hypothetical protein